MWSRCHPGCLQQPDVAATDPAAGSGERRVRGGGGGQVTPVQNVSAVKSADGKQMMVGHLALLFAYIPATGT